MTNEYTAPEVIEIGEATEVILGTKEGFGIDDDGRLVEPAGNLDE
jgi:hypothetical protein